MRDVPGIAWIVGGFLLLAGILFLYSGSGPEPLPAAESVWAQVDQAREGLRSRRIVLRPGESTSSVSKPYRTDVMRLKDGEGPQPVARYLVGVRPVSSTLLKDSWLGEGIDVAFLDATPSEVFGTVRLVSFRKLEPQL